MAERRDTAATITDREGRRAHGERRSLSPGGRSAQVREQKLSRQTPAPAKSALGAGFRGPNSLKMACADLILASSRAMNQAGFLKGLPWQAIRFSANPSRSRSASVA
jgi:hypothetical protein